MNASEYLNYDFVNWYECSSIADVQPQSHCLQLDLATSKGLRVPYDPIPSSLALAVWNAPWTGLESIADVDRNLMSVYLLMITKSTLSLLPPAKVPIFVVVESYSSYSERFEP
jgi:hypothetical protein